MTLGIVVTSLQYSTLYKVLVVCPKIRGKKTQNAVIEPSPSLSSSYTQTVSTSKHRLTSFIFLTTIFVTANVTSLLLFITHYLLGVIGAMLYSKLSSVLAGCRPVKQSSSGYSVRREAQRRTKGCLLEIRFSSKWFIAFLPTQYHEFRIYRHRSREND